jgi:hypothetical protein
MTIALLGRVRFLAQADFQSCAVEAVKALWILEDCRDSVAAWQ